MEEIIKDLVKKYKNEWLSVNRIRFDANLPVIVLDVTLESKIAKRRI